MARQDAVVQYGNDVNHVFHRGYSAVLRLARTTHQEGKPISENKKTKKNKI